MTNGACDRFDREGVERVERGDPLEGHFAECADCLSKAGAYERIRGALSEMEEIYAPPPNWEAKVWAGIRRKEDGKRNWKWALAFATPLAAALVTVVVWPRGEVLPSLQVEVIEANDQTVRGVTARPGDLLRLRATAPTDYAQLRVYRDDQLVIHCSTEAPCKREGDVVIADVPLKALGRYQPVLVFSETEIGTPPSLKGGTANGMNADMEEALGKKMKVQTATAVDVF